MINLQGLQIVPDEKKAPLFSQPDWRLTFQQAVSEISSSNFQTTEEVRNVLRQLGFVNLWFFLKFIVGTGGGPYAKITDHLHMEMCNFYQQSMAPGSRYCGFVPRSFYKSTVWDHGANTFEINRNPNIRIALVSGISDRAMSFMKTTQRAFDDNWMMEWLYPENYVKNPRATSGWSDKMTVMPSRTINHPEPTIQLVTAGGSSQGVHADLLKIDDIVGDSELNADHLPGAEMYRRKNWLMSNSHTLLLDWRLSRIFLLGTRYAIDDPYDFVMEDLNWCTPAISELPYSLRDNGTWSCYYRLIKEDGKITFPENFTEEGLEHLYNIDPWTYWSQYFNNPHKAQSSDIAMYSFKECYIDYESDELVIHIPAEQDKVYVSDCDVVQAIDPAASESRSSYKTSRSAQLVMATDFKGRKFFINGHIDYMTPQKLWDCIVKGTKLVQKWLRQTALEQKGAFKLLGSLFRDWAKEDKISGMIHMTAAQTSGDKDARIRSFLQPQLERGNLYAVEGVREKLQQELDMFPASPMKDGLDATAMAIQICSQPTEPRRIHRMKKKFKAQRQVNSAVTGY